MSPHPRACPCWVQVQLVVLVLTLAALLAACGASGPSASISATATSTLSAGQPADLCAALTAAQIQQVTGVAFTTIVSHPVTGPPGVTQAANCAATPVATTGGSATGAVVFGLQRFTTAAMASAYFTQQRTTSVQAGIKITDLQGIGDQAFVYTNGPSGETVLIAVHSTVFLMLSLDLTPPLAGAQADAERLATLILAHL